MGMEMEWTSPGEGPEAAAPGADVPLPPVWLAIGAPKGVLIILGSGTGAFPSTAGDMVGVLRW